MAKWFPWFRDKRSPPEVPPWAAGQYVTYFLERPSADWMALRFQVMAQTGEDEWDLAVTVKEPRGFGIIRFRATPGAAMALVPKTSTVISGDLDAGLVDAVTLVMNTFGPARPSSGRSPFDKPPRPAERACDVREVYTVTDPWPEFGYTMEHELNPRVYLTGLVSSRIVDEPRFAKTLTSFGCASDGDAAESDLRDYVDFSHPVRFAHGGVSLEYPATWMPLPRRAGPGGGESFIAPMLGGNAHSGVLVLDHLEGTAAEMDAWMDDRVAYWSASPTPGEKLRLRSFEGDRRARLAVADYAHGPIVGVVYEALRIHPSGTRAALARVFTNFFDQHPHAAELPSLEPTLARIAESLAFVEATRP